VRDADECPLRRFTALELGKREGRELAEGQLPVGQDRRKFRNRRADNPSDGFAIRGAALSKKRPPVAEQYPSSARLSNASPFPAILGQVCITLVA
jgi:hypothetical protein